DDGRAPRARGGIRALLHDVFHIPVQARPLPRRPLRGAGAPRPWHRQGVARAPRRTRRRTRLRPPRMARARLEYTLHPVLRIARRETDALMGARTDDGAGVRGPGAATSAPLTPSGATGSMQKAKRNKH